MEETATIISPEPFT